MVLSLVPHIFIFVSLSFIYFRKRWPWSTIPIFTPNLNLYFISTYTVITDATPIRILIIRAISVHLKNFWNLGGRKQFHHFNRLQKDLKKKKLEELKMSESCSQGIYLRNKPQNVLFTLPPDSLVNYLHIPTSKEVIFLFSQSLKHCRWYSCVLTIAG